MIMGLTERKGSERREEVPEHAFIWKDSYDSSLPFSLLTSLAVASHFSLLTPTLLLQPPPPVLSAVMQLSEEQSKGYFVLKSSLFLFLNFFSN